MTSNQYVATAHLLKLLAHPTRLKILSYLKYNEHSVNEMQKLICCRQANLSQHLALLRRENLVKSRKEGKKVVYSSNIATDKILSAI